MTIDRPRAARRGPARLAPERPHRFSMLLSEAEREELDERATRAGYPNAAAFCRARLFGVKMPPAA